MVIVVGDSEYDHWGFLGWSFIAAWVHKSVQGGSIIR